MKQGIVLERGSDGAVATIRIDRPERRNALDAEQWVAFGEALSEIAASPEVRVLVVTGSGTAFASGGDLSRFLAEVRTEGDAKEFRARLSSVFDRLADLPALTIAKVNGPAIGGGLEIAIACDLRIASDNAKMGIPAARFAMTMARNDLERLVDAVGVANARWITLSGRVFEAQEALRLGMVQMVVPADQLDAATDDVIAGLLESDADAIQWFRRSLREIARERPASADLDEQEITSLLSASFRERVTAFLDRERARRASRLG
jgi:enoyl-CoA hydratase/carnithine racemase